MDGFRWVLIVIGLAIIAGVYFFSTANKSKKKLVNNRPLINPQSDRSILFNDPESEQEQREVESNLNVEPVLDEIEEQLDVDELDLAGLFNHASADSLEEQHQESKDSDVKSASPYLLQGNILVFHIKPKHKESLWGNDVLSVLQDYALQYGEMKVFHCKVNDENLFSILNMVEPGSFDIARLTAQQIPGLTAIMQLDRIEKVESGFNTMLKKLGEMADVLDASIYDCKHEMLTNQTLDTIRLAVANYGK